MANSWDEFFASPIKASKKLHVTAQDVARGAKIDARNAQRKAAAEALIAEQSRTVPTGLPYGMTPRPSTVPSDAPSMYSGDNEKVSPTLINDAIAKMTLVGAGNIVGFTPGVGLRAGFSVPAGLDAVANPQEGEVPAAIAGMGALGKATFPALAVLGTAYAANAEAMPFHSWMKRLGASGLPEKTSLYINPDRSELVRMLKDARETYPTDPTVRLLRDRRNTDIYGVEGSSILHDDMRKHLGMTYERAPGTQGSTLPALETEMDFLKQMAPGKFADGGLVKSGLKMLFPNLSAPLHVVKPKGGNWLNNSVEDALFRLKKAPGVERDGVETFSGMSDRAIEDAKRAFTLDDWIEGPLTKYVKNRMASPEDEVRRLAEQGVLHVDPDQLHAPIGLHSGVTRQELGQSPAAKRWEFASDSFIAPETAGLFKVTRGQDGSTTLSRNPWLADLPNEATVYDLGARAHPDNLGFPHLIDELSNALNPNSGLPRNLLLTPEAVKNLSMEKAVRRVADINAWRAAQIAEANQKIAGGPGQELVREYPHSAERPNPKGLRWVELKKQAGDKLSDEQLVKSMEERGMYPEEIETALKDPKQRSQIEEQAFSDVGALADQLRYEGDTMGHCVGGYCDDVASGHSRIFSLRDAKGEPHVTVEVKPGGGHEYAGEKNKEIIRLAEERGIQRYMAPGNEDLWAEAERNLAERGIEQPKYIQQIKGKGNRKPNDEYLPFVQDFVKNPPHGQPWAEVGDLQNTGLRRTLDAFNSNELKKIQEAGIEVPTHATPEELEAINRQIWPDPDVRAGAHPDGFASGGSVGVPAAGWELLTDPTGSPAENKLSWDIFSGHNDPEQLEAVQ